jgi:hypothetical protein
MAKKKASVKKIAKVLVFLFVIAASSLLWTQKQY